MGDLDGDGDLDLVVAKGRHNPLMDRVLLNDGKGSPNAGVQVRDVKRVPCAITAGDLNAVGSPDTVISYEAPSAVCFNDGTGQFTPVTFGDGKGTAYGFAIGDVNGDKFPDIALARSGAPNVLYLSGK